MLETNCTDEQFFVVVFRLFLCMFVFVRPPSPPSLPLLYADSRRSSVCPPPPSGTPRQQSLRHTTTAARINAPKLITRYLVYLYAMQHATLMVEMEDSFAVAAAPAIHGNANTNFSGGNSLELGQWREVDMSQFGSAAKPIVVDDDGDDDNDTVTSAEEGGASGTRDGLRGHAVHASELSPGDQVRHSFEWSGMG